MIDNMLININNFFMLNFAYKIIIFMLFGLCIGSFLNVIIFRLPIILERKWQQSSAEMLQVNYIQPDKYPRRFNLLLPASMCLHCAKPVGMLFNLPLLGFLFTRGKCSNCKHKLSWQYPVVECISVLLFALVAYLHTDWSVIFAQLFFISICLCLVFIDFNTMLLPSELTSPLLWIGLLVNMHGIFAGSLSAALLGAVCGFVVLWLVNYGYKIITHKDGMGDGDFNLFAAILAWLGIQVLIPLIILATSTAIVYFIILYVRKRVKYNSQLPFGPFLSIAGITLLLFYNVLYQFF